MMHSFLNCETLSRGCINACLRFSYDCLNDKVFGKIDTCEDPKEEEEVSI